jgi:hypothetical protein
MMIACLVLGYQASGILARSLPILQDAGFDVFLHLDSKINKAAYLNALGTPAAACRVLDERLNIFWGGYRLMQAGLKLLQAAHDSGPYDRYVLISDDSFPVLPAQALRHYLLEHDDCIQMVRQPEGNLYHQRYYNFFFYDHPATSMRGERDPVIDEAFEHAIAEITVLRRLGKKPIDVYFGSEFWALTHATVSYLLQVVRDDLHLVKSFEYAALPDELMAQSIIGGKFGEDRFTAPVFEDFPKGVGPTVFAVPEELPHLPQNFIFIRKIAPDALGFAEHMADRLRQGLTIFGIAPEAERFGTMFADEQGKRFVNIRLCAPASNSAGWHDREVHLGRPFRWSYSSKLIWEIDVPRADESLELRFFIPLVIIDRPRIYERCYLSIDGNGSKRLAFGGGGLNANIGYTGGGGSITVSVITPPAVSPQTEGLADSRHLGLSVEIGTA